MREVATSHSAGSSRIASPWLGIRECALLLALDSGAGAAGSEALSARRSAAEAMAAAPSMAR